MHVVIEHVARGERFIKNHLIEAAHPEHQLSGRARLRELRLKGFLDYRVHDDNTYEVLTKLEDLHVGWRRLTGIGPVVSQHVALSHLSANPDTIIDAGASGPAPANKEDEEPAEQVDIEEIRKFRMSLG